MRIDWPPRVYVEGLERREIGSGGKRRSYWLGKGAPAKAPLLVVLHGAGISGATMAKFTGLHQRAAKYGFQTVFPDAWGRFWSDGRNIPFREKIDDDTFISELVQRMGEAKQADLGKVFLVGISNGAFLAEHLARYNVLPVKGISLIAGTATRGSREGCWVPQQSTRVLIMAGTNDPIVPYQGGTINRLGRVGEMISSRLDQSGAAVGAEALAQDWVGANHLEGTGTRERLVHREGELEVIKLTWKKPRGKTVELYRIEGGGHTWPGGPQYLPTPVVGPVAQQMDASGLVLEMAKEECL